MKRIETGTPVDYRSSDRESGKGSLALAGSIAPDDLEVMKSAVAECRRVDPNEW